MQPILDLVGHHPATWSIVAIDLRDERRIVEHSPDQILKTASVPKILLLWEISSRLDTGALKPDLLIDRRSTAQVGDSGIWQHLAVDSLPLTDVAAFVGAFSDNLATNALIDLVGLDPLTDTAEKLGCTHTRLNDYVRDHRLPGTHPGSISQGTSRELASLCAELEMSSRNGATTAGRVVEWLRHGVDYSMVLNTFGLDPLSHYEPENGVRVWSKTGTDAGVRADVGVIEGAATSVAYSVIANWEPDTVAVEDILECMGNIGNLIRNYCAG